MSGALRAAPRVAGPPRRRATICRGIRVTRVHIGQGILVFLGGGDAPTSRSFADGQSKGGTMAMRRVLLLVRLLALAALLGACGVVVPDEETTPVPELVLRVRNENPR